jgi:hypothetical protein
MMSGIGTSPEAWDQITTAFRSGLAMLKLLDELQLHQAGAYVSMALETMKAEFPQLAALETDGG